MDKEEVKAWGTLIVLSLIWGTSFILIKKGLVAFSSTEVAILRISISGIAFLPFFLGHIRKLEWRRWWFYLIIALTGSGIPAFFYARAQLELSSATSGVLNSTIPIFTLIIGVVFFRGKTSRKQISGVILGFIGAGMLIYLDRPLDLEASTPIFAASLIIFGSMLYGTNVNLIKEFFQQVPALQLSSFSFVLLGVPMSLIIPFTDIPEKVVTHPHGFESLLALMGLAIFGTVLAIIVFYKLVQETSAIFGSTVAYMIPVVALIWGLIDGEFIGWMHILSLIIIAFGVYMIRAGQPNT